MTGEPEGSHVQSGSADLDATVSSGDPFVRDLLLGGTIRSARIEQLGRRRHADRERQTAARQRSAPGHAHSVALVSRPHVGRRLRRDRRDAARRAGGGDRTQSVHRLGRNQRRRGRRGSVSRADRRVRQDRGVPRRAGTDSNHSGNDCREGRGADSRSTCASRGTVRSSPTRINANNAASKTEPKPPTLEPLAFRWTALDDEDSTVVAFLKLNDAHNWNEFTAALRHFVVPAQNFVYADVDGHIGYYAPGRIPVRASGDGSRPVEGWTGDSEWIGSVPFEELPHTFDPPEHFIVTANNRPMPRGLSAPHRARISRAVSRATDHRSARAEEALDGRAISRRFRPTRSRCTRRRSCRCSFGMSRPTMRAPGRRSSILGQWNFTASGDSAAAAIFQAWFRHLAPAIVGDELGPQVTPSYEGRFSYITRFVTNIVTAGSSPWCDNVNTPQKETCDQTLTKALEDGLDESAGADGQRSRHVALGHSSPRGVSASGSRLGRASCVRSSVDRFRTAATGARSMSDRLRQHHPYDQVSVPGYRQIVDLSPANDSRFLDAVGEGGHFLSRALRRFPGRLASRASQEDADDAGGCRQRRDWNAEAHATVADGL